MSWRIIRIYEQHLLRSPALLEGVHELHGQVLRCFCAPAPCHGDVLAHYADAIAITWQLPEHTAMSVIYPAS